jgi:pimeloyl-ACP methyl ester carboxylesterase
MRFPSATLYDRRGAATILVFEEARMPTVEIDGTKIHYQVSGDGPPVLLIMGLATPAMGWIGQVPAFGARYRTIAFDNRGSGRSSCPPGPWTIGGLAADAVGLLDRLDVPRAHVVGISMGGMIAQEIAIEHPGRVGALVLASTYAAPGGDVRRLSQSARSALGVDAGGGDALGAIRLLGEAAFSPGFMESQGLVFFQMLMQAMPQGPSLAGIEAQSAAALRFDARERLARVAAPTLVLTGDQDRLIAAAHSDEIARLVPKSCLERIAGGSHAVNFERAEEWNRVVLGFLREHDALVA